MATATHRAPGRAARPPHRRSRAKPSAPRPGRTDHTRRHTETRFLAPSGRAPWQAAGEYRSGTQRRWQRRPPSDRNRTFSGPCDRRRIRQLPLRLRRRRARRGLADATDARLIVAHIYAEAIGAIDIVPPPGWWRNGAVMPRRRSGARASSSTASTGGRPAARLRLRAFRSWAMHEVADREGAPNSIVVGLDAHGTGLGRRQRPALTGERAALDGGCISPSRSRPPAGAAE